MSITLLRNLIILIFLLLIIGFIFQGNTTPPRSPFYGGVQIKEVSAVGKTNPQEEYIILEVGQVEEESIDISRWVLLRERESDVHTVPLPPFVRTLRWNEPQLSEPLHITSEDILIITTGRSPVGKSFAVTVCSGYTQQIFTFYPPIKEECPNAGRVFTQYSSYADSSCEEFLRMFPGCRVPRMEERSGIQKECEEFIDREIHEAACIERRKESPLFFTGEIRLYLSRMEELWQKEDIISLLDENGLIVHSRTF